MYIRFLLKTLVFSLLLSAKAFALPAAAEKAFSNLTKNFKKPGIELVASDKGGSGVSKIAGRPLVAVQLSMIETQVTELRTKAADVMDDTISVKERFALNQTKSALSQLKNSFTATSCKDMRVDGFTKIEKAILVEFEPTALSTQKVESEVIQRTFDLLHQMCVQLEGQQQI